VIATFAQKRDPSLRTRQTSSSKPAFSCRNPSFHLWLAGVPVFSRIETREVPADNLLRAVSLNVLGALHSSL